MSEPRPVQTFVGVGLMAVGALIAALCGSCSALVLSSTLSGLTPGGAAAGALAVLLIVAIIGGIPTLFGLWIMRRGWRALQPTEEVPRSRIALSNDEPDPGDTP